MLNLQEITTKATPQLKNIETFMDKNGYWDPQENHLLYDGLKRSIQREVSETLHHASLKEMLQHTGGLTTGHVSRSGANYLIPVWMSNQIANAVLFEDIVPRLSSAIVEPNGLSGEYPILAPRVGIAHRSAADASGHYAGPSGGEGPTQTPRAIQASYQLKRIVLPIGITGDMLDDNEYGLMETAVRFTSMAIAHVGNNWALWDLRYANDGFGTLNTEDGSADETTLTDVTNAIQSNANDGFKSDTFLTTMESWRHSIIRDTTAVYPVDVTYAPVAQGFDAKILNLDVLFSTCEALYNTIASGTTDQVTEGGVMTNCRSIVYTRALGMITLRKNWLRIENYADPIRDLQYAVLSGRQDSITINKSSICLISEQ